MTSNNLRPLGLKFGIVSIAAHCSSFYAELITSHCIDKVVYSLVATLVEDLHRSPEQVGVLS